MLNKGLYLLRVFNFLNQTEMAKRCGISTAMYCRIENKKRKGSDLFWKRLQDEFGLSNERLSEIMEG